MRKQSKPAALALLLIYGFSVFYPNKGFGLTNGPTAPESSQFQAASVTNLVDPFSGDFSYNIPLLDVDGYPINISYNSGGSMDDEASWVGYGWNINPGSVSRVMKGIPDDFDGTDKISKDYNIRKDVTGGISFNASLEIFGLDFLGANASADIFYNNHRGLGVEIGAGISATLSTAKHQAGDQTAGLSAGANLGITSSSQTGADFNFGINAGTSIKDKEGNTGALGLRFGGSLNSRAGMKSTTLGISFNTSKGESLEACQERKELNEKYKINIPVPGAESYAGSSGSFTSTYGQAFNPTITMPMKNESFSLSPEFGPEFWGLQLFLQATAHYSQQKLAQSHKDFPAYGYLHSNKGRVDKDALLDFNREKDVPYMESTPTLAVPYVTPDLFTASSQGGTSQFKAFSNGSGVFFDSYGTNSSDAFSLGIEFGAGWGIKAGGDLSFNGSNTVTKKWNLNNDFLRNGDFPNATGPDGEDTYFKLVGEKSSVNRNYLNRIIDREPVKVTTKAVDNNPIAYSALEANNKFYPVTSAIARNTREPKGEMFVPLTADKAGDFGLDKYIKNYAPATLGSVISCNNGVFGSSQNIGRIGHLRKANHFSEITVTKGDGMRMVYGIPVYNNSQTDVTFNTRIGVGDNNLVNYAAGEDNTSNSSGLDHYFSAETVPAYATSFLLTGVCSPDYVDVTGNGISDDDLGSAVKFNYSLADSNYRWRTPGAKNRGAGYANFSEGFKSETNDNKASYSYGTKELWYTQSIESKNMIAVFRTSDRQDGLGFLPDGTLDISSKEKELDRIDLYTKAELLTHPNNPVPVKSVFFVYDYSLFPNVQNNNSGGGKLTLKSIYFTYGNSNSGSQNRYYFNYNESGNYLYQQYDRWGNYKSSSWNNSPKGGVDLDNNDFPYTIQDKDKADESAKKWQLSEIELPSGGKINVDYESDDYAYVQNKRAMQMVPIIGYGDKNKWSGYQKDDNVYVKLPDLSKADNFRSEYFEGVDQLYFKAMVNLDGSVGTGELVSGYAKIVGEDLMGSSGNVLPSGSPVQSDVVRIRLEKKGDYHPIAAAAWQFMKLNTPKLAYPYSVNEDLSPLGFVKALIAAIGNVAELLTPFEAKAMRKGFASSIQQGRGFARIDNKFQKFGGGSRVKQITMNDRWRDMAGAENGKNAITGMSFEYTKKSIGPDGHEILISSGVASYEPMAGSDENPFHQPINYQQKQHLTSNIYTVEEPLGESYFPAPSVGYSQVVIRNLDVEGNVVNNGYSVKKFYTEKDFPTIVKRTDLSKTKYNQKSIFSLFNIDNGNSVVLSQGYLIETNDMHGKPLSDETFDGTGKMLAGTYNHYKSKGSEQMELDNNALTLHPDGTVQNDLVAEEFEMYNDMREQDTENVGVNLNLNLDVLLFAFFTIPIPTAIPIVQTTNSGYNSASTVKVINHYAIPDKVTTIENGSTMIAENVLWDALTGQVLLTKTQNGFDDPIYNFSLPAYLVNEYEQGMGAAYHNTGVVLNGVTIGTDGKLPSSIANQHLVVPGDQIGVVGSQKIIWATDVDRTGHPDIRLLEADGSMYSTTLPKQLIILRSGRRNLLGAGTYSVVSLKSPINNGRIEISAASEILNSSAGTFDDEWSSAAQYMPCSNKLGKAGETRVYNKVLDPMNVTFTAIPISSLAKRTGQTNTTTTGCDPCNDLNDYLIETYEDVPNSKTCIHAKYICADPFPDNKTAIFNFYRPPNTSAFGQFGTIEISRNTTDVTLCFDNTSIYSGPIFLKNWRCLTKVQSCGDVCTDTSAFNITAFGEDYGIQGSNCGDGRFPVVVRYNCMTPFPTNKIVHFTFNLSCTGINETHTVDISSGQLEGMACFQKGAFIVCGGAITLVSVSCTTTGCCPSPINQVINPYYTGLKGNWRGKESYVYTVNRDPRIDAGNNNAKLPTNLRKGGIFADFTSFYKIASNQFTNNLAEDNIHHRWIASATVTKVNSKGQEVENKNALGKYSSAQFGFNDLASTAVCSNARDNELAYDGFEDYMYSSNCGSSQNSLCNEDGHFNFKKGLRLANGNGFLLTTNAAHTGNYSLQVARNGSDGADFAFTKRSVVATLDDQAKYEFNSSKEMLLKPGGLLNDFSPVVGKKYVISGWIKGDVASEADPENTDKAKITIEGFAGTNSSGYKVIAVKAGPKVEGWTRVMATFELPADLKIDNVVIRLVAGASTSWFDDIRIHPYDGNMKSFAYDYRTSRLMAVLDENNYATFFEYDDEGQLLRNKKETEKGIVTLKETRSRVHKNHD